MHINIINIMQCRKITLAIKYFFKKYTDFNLIGYFCTEIIQNDLRNFISSKPFC